MAMAKLRGRLTPGRNTEGPSAGWDSGVQQGCWVPLEARAETLLSLEGFPAAPLLPPVGFPTTATSR